MKQTMLSAMLVAGLATLGGPTTAAEVVDTEQTLLCALSQYAQCDAGADCVPMRGEDISAPRWLEVSFKNKAIAARTLPTDPGRISEVERFETVGDVVVLQGAEKDLRPDAPGMGFTLAIARSTGHLTMTASGNQVAFIAFGACLPLAP